jgi:cell wall-associated NlpC family hydrolase
MPPVRRTLRTLLAGLVAAGALTVAAALAVGSEEAARPQPVAAAPVASESGMQVVSPTGEVLAEMTRRQGTPRRVARVARRHARTRARIAARARARIQAAERAAEAARAAAAQRTASPAPSDGNAPYWWDPAAAAVANTGPASAAEQEWLSSGRGGWIEANGFARAPRNAPPAVHRIIQAGNLIARSPYKWGGGHGVWRDNGYDCSGSVSYALAAGGLLGSSHTSGQLMNWGADGPGRWVTIYTNQGHVFMIVAGLRFDTSGRRGDHASRWQLAPRSAEGFAVRHHPGL